MDLDKLDTFSLSELKKRVDKEELRRKNGPKKPVHVVEEGDTNSCFKVQEEAKDFIAEFPFDPGINSDDYSGSLRCYVRWMPEHDYNKAPDSWIEV